MRARLAVVPALVAMAGAALAQDAAPDSAREALRAELEALRQELDRPTAKDPFEEGRAPDLVIVSTHTLTGEVSPCG